MDENNSEAGKSAVENPSKSMTDSMNELTEAVKKQERATSEQAKNTAANDVKKAAEKWIDAFGEHAGIDPKEIEKLKEEVGKIEGFKDLKDAIGGSAKTDIIASDGTKAAIARLRGAMKGAFEQVDKAVSNILESRRSPWQKFRDKKSQAMKKFDASSAAFEPASIDYYKKTTALHDAERALEKAMSTGQAPTNEQTKAVSDATTAFETSQKKYKEAQEKHGKVIDEVFSDGSEAKKKVEAQGGGKWRSIKELLLNWKLWAMLIASGGTLGVYLILKGMADDMTGCYKYIGTSSSQLASCHGLEDDGLEAACACGTLSDAKTGGAKDSGTCCDGGGSSADCGGQVFCAKATCKKCSSTDCADPPGKACGCAPGPPCNNADLQHAIQYTYTKYTPWDALAGIFDHGAGDWEHVGDELIGVVKDILIIVVIVAGIALLIWVVAKVVNHIRNKKGGNEGGKAHDNVVIVQEPAVRRRRSRRKN